MTTRSAAFTTPVADPALRIGPIEIASPVVLAPMAGVTNEAFRRLCQEYGAGLYVTEMVTTRALVERKPATMRLIRHHPAEEVRSIQLYGVDPRTIGDAVALLVDEDRTDHLDLNFGCPVPKVTRKGGGSALPWKRDLFEAICLEAVKRAGDVPVTVKIRKGINEDRLTYLESARIAEGSGIAGITLHARTLEQQYSGKADWSAIETLKSAVSAIPVLGNGDVFEGEDGPRMVAETGCDGVVVGRGVLGRPWLFADLQAAFAGRPDRVRPGLREVGAAMIRHAELLHEFYEDEGRASRDFRKHVAWYFKGYPVGGEVRQRYAKIDTIDQLRELVAELPDEPWPGRGAMGTRGRAGSARRAHLPEGWLDSRTMSSADASDIADAELDISGG
ncbi:tRNA dihydrouridine synthase DusB [Gulosibacter sp. 10]|uniref:tRNA dihydrouridine synthase DusB n=1 Tax=Gulosibacter sp. 10 TaxID=1255570 RepID=UPI00097E8327|nr:tRNA dihydrouridine synthase DusB [Gulosibacter sp. 10]SJM48833.1 tRNA dihydrouridine synthase B [Gulosibacter sp. 10]